tara:strand:- start:59 stop:886 length:828 start_codon:yes stop_codon:yes gene_type:complete
MSKVIKNNDGVAIVEGTPAASLVKDADKFFKAKIDTRMAGEAVKPQTIKSIVDSGKIDTRLAPQSEQAVASSALTKPMMEMIDGRNTIVGYMVDGETTMFNEAQMNLSPVEKADLLPQRVKTAMQGGDPGGKGKSLNPKEINTKRPTAADLEQMNNYTGQGPIAAGSEVVLDTLMGKRPAGSEVVLDTFMGKRPPMTENKDPVPVLETLSEGPKFSEPTTKPKTEPKTEPTTDPDAILAMNLARDFKRQRSAKEARRSQDERSATRGRFISTLRR